MIPEELVAFLILWAFAMGVVVGSAGERIYNRVENKKDPEDRR